MMPEETNEDTLQAPPRPPARRLRPFSRDFLVITALLLLILVVGGIGALLTRPGPLHAPDQLLAEGRYYEALQHYQLLADEERTPDLSLRLGILFALRGEYAQAEPALWHVMSATSDAADYELAKIHLGHVLASRGQPERAQQAWQRRGLCTGPPERCPHAGLLEIVQAEWALRQDDYAEAEAGYQAALALPLPKDWHALAVYRLALLQAADDPAQARATLEAPPSGRAASPAPLLEPLLPEVAGTQRNKAHLLTVLQADEQQQAQLLGQFYLDAGLPQLAAAQFAQVEPDNPYALAAAIQDAYARWLAGDSQASLAQLEQQAAVYPSDPRLPTLLVLASIDGGNMQAISATQSISSTLSQLAIHRADTHLAWAAWYIAHSDYAAARKSYRVALALAPPDQRGRYALLVARFHLRTSYEICTSGIVAAEIATRELPASADAWATLAGSSYQCGEFEPAIEAARRALADGPRADASFYLGAALAHSGEADAARTALIRAADLAPASMWRRRAEFILADLAPMVSSVSSRLLPAGSVHCWLCASGAANPLSFDQALTEHIAA
jgi:Flp pilus assembly protein TadD